MTAPVIINGLSARCDAPGLEHALTQAQRLLVTAEAHALVMGELGQIELPAAARADPVQLRAIASLYLASTLEAAGLIQATEDFTRLVRSGGIPGDLGDAAPLVAEFWSARNERTSTEERLALFARLFGAPAGPADASGPVNDQFEDRLLDLCDAIMAVADGGSVRRVREAGVRLAENVAASANDMVLMMARDIIGSLGQAIAILNHEQVHALLAARSLWDCVAAVDRRFRRPARPTLSHLRRGRAGMAVLAWLADKLEALEKEDTAVLTAGDSVIDAAVNWVDESLSVIRAEERAAEPRRAAAGGGTTSGAPGWLDLAR